MKKSIFFSSFFFASVAFFSCEKTDSGPVQKAGNELSSVSGPSTTCETAFARKTYVNHAYCFTELDMDSDGTPDFNRWGWSNGPLTEGTSTWYNLYASAGQCDPAKGVLVGRMDVHYYAGTVRIVMSVINGYTLDETHLYVGNTILPVKNGKYTVAPGQYPYSHDLTNARADYYTINNVSGTIYVIMHAVVCRL